MWPLLHELVTPADCVCVVCSLVNQRHFLYNRIAWLEGRPTYLQGQQHQWQVVPPPGHPPANGGYPSPDGGHPSPDAGHLSPHGGHPSPDAGHLSPGRPSDDWAHCPPDRSHPSPEETHPSPDGARHPYDEAYPSPDGAHHPIDEPYGDIEAAYDSDTNNDARSFATQASDLIDLEAGDGARSDPVSSETMCLNDTGITTSPVTHSAAGGEEEDVYGEEADPEIESAAIVYDEVEDTSSDEAGHQNHTAAVLADHADTPGTDAFLSSIADASGTAAVPNNSGRDAVSPSHLAGTAEEGTDCCSTTEDSTAIQTPAQAPDAEGVVAQLEDRVKTLEKEVQELHGIAHGYVFQSLVFTCHSGVMVS